MDSKKKVTRQELVNKFKTMVKQANKVLAEFDKQDKRFILEDDYGATFHDKTIVTIKGTFRSNAKELNMKELESRIKMMKEFMKDSPIYFNEADEIQSYADKMFKYQQRKKELGGVGDTNIAKDLGDFFIFAKSMLGDTFDPSETSALQIAENMLMSGLTIDQVENKFIDAVIKTYGTDYGYLIDEFAFDEQGVYL